MKERTYLISVGIVIYIVMSAVDRFIYPIPNIIYIPLAILGITIILIGWYYVKKKDS